ncbi:VOC family protein [Pikeienuella piscinae]|uniref:VOC family protein n=1 Tax=Pikeienuella piscinae TaxID=2748098 RepID=A0A7M3T6B3_9RHOB|nr:VOC family protein [Pikeienuella piscinae]QIE57544.1 VOC family protein [Pikeienuella piscinae]
MAHQSRIGVIVIDCQTEDLTAALAFWKEALGCEGEIDDDGKYAQLHTGGQLRVLLQKVGHEPRVHLDIETDDREAERARLAAVGAKPLESIKTWHVMEAPTGHRFCIVGPQGGDFPAGAAEWED